MLRLPMFGVQTPTTIPEVVAALATPGARIVAGGTDILPNLKHRLDQPPTLISLACVDELRSIAIDGDHLQPQSHRFQCHFAAQLARSQQQQPDRAGSERGSDRGRAHGMQCLRVMRRPAR